jgi:hypothetical protein
MGRKQTVSLRKEGARTVAHITGNDHTPHWKRACECRNGWFSARFNNETEGRISIDISENAPGKDGRGSQKRIMIMLDADAARALAAVIAAEIEF